MFFMVILLMAEIRRSPVEVGSLCHYLRGFSTIQTVVGNGISAINSTVQILGGLLSEKDVLKNNDDYMECPFGGVCGGCPFGIDLEGI